MAVRSARLAAASSSPANAEHTIYTCPSGKTALVKDLSLYSGAGCSVAAIFVERSGPVRVSVTTGSLGADATRRLSTFVVLEPGDTIGVYSESGTFTVWVSGAELDGVAP